MGEKVLYLRRKIDSVLDDWKMRSDRKPILLKGARQVGKTEAVRAFATRHYDSFIEINFSLQPQYKQIVEDGYDAKSIRKRISALNPTARFPEHRTLLFFDEIQDFPDIATSFKSFKEEGCFDVVSSGSMLGVQYKNVASIPVGFKEDLSMESLDFEEFLWAAGRKEDFVEDLYGRLLSLKPLDEGLLSPRRWPRAVRSLPTTSARIRRWKWTSSCARRTRLCRWRSRPVLPGRSRCRR